MTQGGSRPYCSEGHLHTPAWAWSATYPIPHGAGQCVSLQVEVAKCPLYWPMCSNLNSKTKDSKVMMDTAGPQVTAWRRATQGRCEAPTVRRTGHAHCGQALAFGFVLHGSSRELTALTRTCHRAQFTDEHPEATEGQQRVHGHKAVSGRAELAQACGLWNPCSPFLPTWFLAPASLHIPRKNVILFQLQWWK